MEVDYGDNPVETLGLDDDDLTNGSITIFQQMYVNNRYDLVSKIEGFSNGDSYMGSIMDLRAKYYGPSLSIRERITIACNQKKLFSKGSTINFNISGVANKITFYNGTTVVRSHPFNSSSVSQVNIIFVDGSGNETIERITDYTLKSNNNGTYSFEFTYKDVPKDTYTFRFEFFYTMDGYSGYSSYYDTYNNNDMYFDREGGILYSYLSIEETPYDEKVGLLEGIIQFLTSIRDSILNLPSVIINGVKGFFDNVVNSITSMASAITDKLQSVLTGIQNKLQSVLDGITNALVTLGNFIIDGIKGLFVPSQEDITDMKDDWETLLATRFGALYEVVQLCIDYANSFNSAASVSVANGGSSTITIPVVSVPLGEVSFDFGGWEVDLIPSGFEFLIDTLKLMVSVCATVLFVNGLRNKFERLVER